jgi:hypothetical protein
VRRWNRKNTKKRNESKKIVFTQIVKNLNVWAGRIPQVVEHMSSKWEALSSASVPSKKI